MISYEEQAEIIIENLIEKGYEKGNLVGIKNEVGQRDRQTLLRYKKKSPSNEGKMSFIYDFNSNNREIRKIVSKYWPILRQDPTLSTILQEKPNFICRGANNLKKSLVHNAIRKKKGNNNPFNVQEGFYGCGACGGCKGTGNKK